MILFGRSIGTGPAARLAADVPCGGLILISPYTSVKDLVPCVCVCVRARVCVYSGGVSIHRDCDLVVGSGRP